MYKRLVAWFKELMELKQMPIAPLGRRYNALSCFSSEVEG
jgi:hypothetical protein